MSARTRLSSHTVNAQAEATAKLLNGGFFDLMTGEQPESADDLVDDDLRLARHSFGAVAFATPRDGVLQANPITKAVATRTGAPTWCRCSTKEGLPVLDGSAGKPKVRPDGTVDKPNALTHVEMIVEGQIVNITGFKHVISKQAGA